MPGMVAGHAHLSYPDFDAYDLFNLDMRQSPIHLAVLAARNAETTLKAGFTAAASAGSLHQIDRMLKDFVRAGVVCGPRLMACGQDIVTTGGGLDIKPSWWELGMQGLPLIVDGPIEVRRAVRLQAKEGNDFIKIYPEGGHGVVMQGMDMEPDEIQAAVDAAHDKGKLVRAHAVTRRAIHACLDAGVDIIDHCDHLDEAVIARLVEQGVFILPSLYVPTVYVDIPGEAAKSGRRRERLERSMDKAAQMLARAQAAGVKIVIGDDFGTALAPHGDNGKELALYVDRLGLPAMDVIGWATRNGAEMMRQGDQFGTIAPGKLADLLVVDGDPLAQMSLLGDPANLAVVMQEGRFVTDRLAAEGAA
jgi:imidazolonepropionase-like amidohydrolase